MKASDLAKMIEDNKPTTAQINMEILKWLYPEFIEYHERFGILFHSKLGVASGIPLPNYIGSLEAAIEATNKLLPQADWSIYRQKEIYEVCLWLERSDKGEDPEFTTLDSNPAKGLLIVAFKAKEAMMQEYEDE